MILIVESDPGGMSDYLYDEKKILEQDTFLLHRHWSVKDSFEIKKFAKTAGEGDYMHFSKGIFIKVDEELEMANKEIVPKTD